MDVGLKIWRYDAATGDRALREYEIDVPDEATLLDTLDAVKDRVDGSLAYRKSCRMMICGSCGMRVDGGAVLACKTRIADITAGGRVPVISAMGNLPVVKDLVVDMDPFWAKMRAVQPYLTPRYDQAAERENVVPQHEMDVIHKESLCINCGCCVSECNSMESDPDFLGPAALAKAYRFVGDPRDAESQERLHDLANDPHGIYDCTHCFSCIDACPKGVAPMDQIMRLRRIASDEYGIDDHNNGFRHEHAFTKIIEKKGTLDESLLLQESYAPGVKGKLIPRPSAIKGLLESIPTAIRGLRTGKMRSLPKLIPGMHPKLPGDAQQNVKRIYAHAEDHRIELNLYIKGEEAEGDEPVPEAEAVPEAAIEPEADE